MNKTIQVETKKGREITSGQGKNIFVVQKHDTRNLHYDLRIEMDNNLYSWVIPKGPSMVADDKRLAVFTHSHPLPYASFEGEIPEDKYGAGKIIVWDIGYYENISTANEREIPIVEAFKIGKMKLRLDGDRLEGDYALIELADDDGKWIIFKMQNSLSSNIEAITEKYTDSVISDEEI
ncbi:MAG: DNA polymerase ligase N-terminal domain-containing protein [Candidatus Zixiibacteriota bacterium]